MVLKRFTFAFKLIASNPLTTFAVGAIVAVAVNVGIWAIPLFYPKKLTDKAKKTSNKGKDEVDEQKKNETALKSKQLEGMKSKLHEKGKEQWTAKSKYPFSEKTGAEFGEESNVEASEKSTKKFSKHPKRNEQEKERESSKGHSFIPAEIEKIAHKDRLSLTEKSKGGAVETKKLKEEATKLLKMHSVYAKLLEDFRCLNDDIAREYKILHQWIPHEAKKRKAEKKINADEKERNFELYQENMLIWEKNLALKEKILDEKFSEERLLELSLMQKDE
ncbi:hypothetical protein G9A89_007555 [Geosiphon pyriformis]|nr:hypothetical protein G9A89_007555 [Geosiphon pyriformis]